MDTKVTSKTSSLKALLLKAWSERWSDLQWGIHIKAILPRGVSGDVYNLADIIFQQALVGPGPNELILSYLKHSLSSQLVSYSAVVLRISKFNGFHKPYCVISLLKFLENIQDGITCRTKQEEAVLSGSILSLVNWLLHCYHYYLTHPTQFPELTKKPVVILNKIMQNPFTLALLYLSKYENRTENIFIADMYEMTVKKCREIESCLEKIPIPNDIGVDVPLLLKNIVKLDLSVLKTPTKKQEFIDFSIQALLKVTALLNPTIDSQSVVNNLLIVQQLKGYKNSRLYMELIRASFINLYDDLLESGAVYWGAFTFIKLPQIIQLLATHYTSSNNLLPEQASKEVVDGFILLMEFCPLLNNIDTHTQNNNVETLLKEMVPLQIISEADKNKILEIRRENSINTSKIAMLVPQEVSSSFLSIISKTTPAMNKFMKSLDSDRPQEHFISMLSQLLTGKSYELILTFASVKGELRTFVHKLIKYNELSRQVGQNDGISPYVKALLFDLTFVILCSIVQKYGSDKVLPNKDGTSFFETWVRECMKEHDCNKAMTALNKAYETGKVEKLIEFFKSGEFDLRNTNMPWDEICFAMPAVMKEIHDGWRNTGNTEIHDGWRNTYANNDVKHMLDAIASQMCCLSICSVSWLCSYMQILQQTELLKPRNMVQQFMTLMVNEEGQQEFRTVPMGKQQQQDYYKDRCIISFHIMRQMQYEVSPPMTFTEVPPLSRSIISKDAVYKQLVPTWEVVLKKGCLTTEAVQLFKSVICVSDPRLFMKFMLHEIIKLRFEDELNKAVDLLFALFHFNIHDCTVALLNYLPHLLFRTEKVELVEPQSTAIAKLTAYAVCAAVQMNTPQKKVELAKNMDVEQELEGSKIMRMSDLQSGNTRLVYVSIGCGSSSQQQTITDGPLLKALTTLFRAFDNVADQTGVVTCDTYFVFNVIKQIVDCGKETAKPILATLSNTLIPNLMRSVPDLFTMELILQLYGLSTAAGRKTAVRDLCLLRNLTMKS